MMIAITMTATTTVATSISGSGLLPPYEEHIRQLEIRSARTTQKAHGRRETRVIEATSVLEDCIDWPGASQFAKITRHRTVRGERSREVEYLLTSLSPDQAGPEALLRIRRAHWGVES